MADFSRKNILTMLDYVDCDPARQTTSKRRDAYVTEMYFEHEILPRIVKGKASTGWCYVERGKGRHWFKYFELETGSDASRSTEREIIRSLMEKDNSSRFFSIGLVGNQHFTLYEIVHNGTSLVQRKVDNVQHYCDLMGMEIEAEDLSEKESHPNPFTERWLATVSESYKKKLLIQRLLMNTGLKEAWPLDVDAIEVNDNLITFHEFKRKTPCPDGCFIIKGNTVTKSLLLDILQKCRRSDKKYGDELFRFVENNLYCHRDEHSHCFGLDLSHLSNFEYCQKNDIAYVHTIWDSSEYPDKPDIKQLFDDGVKPKNGLKLIIKQLKVNDFTGFIFTQGFNSGSFNRSLRLQATISGDVFSELN